MMPNVESIIEPTLARYIDATKLEKLLKKIFNEDIAVYVSLPHTVRGGPSGYFQFRVVAEKDVLGKEWGVQLHCAETPHRGSLAPSVPRRGKQETC